MPSLTENLQASARAISGTAGQLNEDLHAAFTVRLIPDGQISERMLAYAVGKDSTITNSGAAWNYLLANGVV